MEWSPEMCLNLIDLYADEPILWDTKHQYHYSKKRKWEAWSRIATSLEYDVREIQRKMFSLLGSFRTQKGKCKKIVKNGKGM